MLPAELAVVVAHDLERRLEALGPPLVVAEVAAPEPPDHLAGQAVDHDHRGAAPERNQQVPVDDLDRVEVGVVALGGREAVLGAVDKLHVVLGVPGEHVGARRSDFPDDLVSHRLVGAVWIAVVVGECAQVAGGGIVGHHDDVVVGLGYEVVKVDRLVPAGRVRRAYRRPRLFEVLVEHLENFGAGRSRVAVGVASASQRPEVRHPEVLQPPAEPRDAVGVHDLQQGPVVGVGSAHRLHRAEDQPVPRAGLLGHGDRGVVVVEAVDGVGPCLARGVAQNDHDVAGAVESSERHQRVAVGDLDSVDRQPGVARLGGHCQRQGVHRRRVVVGAAGRVVQRVSVERGVHGPPDVSRHRQRRQRQRRGGCIIVGDGDDRRADAGTAVGDDDDHGFGVVVDGVVDCCDYAGRLVLARRELQAERLGHQPGGGVSEDEVGTRRRGATEDEVDVLGLREGDAVGDRDRHGRAVGIGLAEPRRRHRNGKLRSVIVLDSDRRRRRAHRHGDLTVGLHHSVIDGRQRQRRAIGVRLERD